MLAFECVLDLTFKWEIQIQFISAISGMEATKMTLQSSNLSAIVETAKKQHKTSTIFTNFQSI